MSSLASDRGYRRQYGEQIHVHGAEQRNKPVEVCSQ
jgi:hypothetical protein